MIAIPFIYFTSYFVYIYKKNGLDVAAYMAFLYALTGFFSIILSNTNLEYAAKEVAFLPTLLYCILITCCISPFVGLRLNTKIFSELNINIKIFNYLSYFYIVSFLFTIILFWDDMVFRLTVADFKAMRGADDFFMQTAQAKLSGPLRILSSIFGIFNSMSWIVLLLFFYSICFLQKKIWFNLLLLLSSTSCIILGIIGIDRSIVFYWLLLLGFSFILFYKYIPAKKKKWIFISFSILVGLLMMYFIAVTMSRFGDEGSDKEGAFDSIIEYAGQNFINFCWFWDNFNLPNINLTGLFPAINHFFIGDPGIVEYGKILELKLGFFVNYFYTYLGSWMIYVGQFGTIILVVIYSISVRKMLVCKRKVNLGVFMRTFIIGTVPACGVILYTYTSYMVTISALILYILSFYISKT